MTTQLSLTARKAELFGLRNALDAGGGKMKFYEGAPPALPDQGLTVGLLATIALSATSGLIGSAGVLATLTFTVPLTTLASASGLIGFARIEDGDGNGFMDLLVGEAGSGTPVVVNAAQVYAGGEVRLVSCVIAK